MAQVFDADGTAVVLHQGVDDYATDPAGAAGDRIACGVVMK
jgi:superoxide dismutase, Cu-Zn family